MNDKVSIIIPIYNSEETLRNCLESIINQTYKNIEVILINDGSIDDSGSICDYYAEQDFRFLVKHCENKGVSSARNTGIDLATGQYMIFIDSDDEIKSNMIEEMLYYLKTSKCDVLIAGISFIENGRLTNQIVTNIMGKFGLEVWKYICEDSTGLYGYVSNKLYKTDIIKSNAIYFDENRKIQEDLDFALRVYNKSKFFYLLNKSYYLYNYNPKGRIPDVIGYMEIEINKRNILKSKNIFNKYSHLHYNKISSMIFCYLYNLPTEKSLFNNGINNLYNLDNIDESLKINKVKGKENKFIIFLLKNRYTSYIRYYFIFRKYIKYIINNKLKEG